MKKAIAFLLALVLGLSLCACGGAQPEITCDDVIAAYESAGYEVLHMETATEDRAYECYIQAKLPDSTDYIMFHFFESPEAAEDYADSQKWNIAVWLYSLAMFQPTWLTTRTYRNIEIEYADRDLYKPFKTLLK